MRPSLKSRANGENTFRSTIVTVRIESLSYYGYLMGICALLRKILASGLARRALFALLIIALFLGGVQLRRWIGGSTRHVRYQHDTVNAFYWGSEALKEARRLSPND